jgi:hypothetical protein
LPRENDLEGQQDMGGKHGGQAGQPKSPARPQAGPRDEDALPRQGAGQTEPASAPTKKKWRGRT